LCLMEYKVSIFFSINKHNRHLCFGIIKINFEYSVHSSALFWAVQNRREL
jgi:hypothetical protein